LDELDNSYAKLIGIYAESFYFKRGTFARLRRDFMLLWDDSDTNKVSPSITKEDREVTIDELRSQYKIQKPFGKQEMLRDLFLRSVYAGHVHVAFVLLLQLKSRIGAALLATNMARRLSLLATNLDTRRIYAEQSKVYELYASTCIKACHSFNERLACQLLLREIPLFGNITCMQVRTEEGLLYFICIYTRILLAFRWIKRNDVIKRQTYIGFIFSE
jgi:hypothetical protein